MTELRDRINAYRNASNAFLISVKDVTPENIDISSPDGWSARQVIHHIADSETQSYARLRRILAEPGSTISGYDEGLWAHTSTLGYQDLPIKNSLAVFTAVRNSSADILDRITESDLQLEVIHSDSGKYTLNDWLRRYTNHPAEHAEQLRLAIQSEN